MYIIGLRPMLNIIVIYDANDFYFSFEHIYKGNSMGND